MKRLLLLLTFLLIGNAFYAQSTQSNVGTSKVKNSQKIDLQIFPNPVSSEDQLIIRNNQSMDYEMTIFDSKGAKVKSILSSARSETALSTAGMHTGVYFYRLKNKQYYKAGSFLISD